MNVAAGNRIGPYEILSPLGAGGMGEVYRATDTRLGRTVALKVLPEDFLEDEERRRRFEKEARTLASLNHPSIATIHSFEEIPGSLPSSPPRHVLTMELLEGESLREVILRRTPTTRQVLSWALQAAQGLAAAHQKGIVHRDIKPENLFLTSDGRIKILDFGLAKLVARTPAETEAATESGLSVPGVIVGTVAYMSPEQIEAEGLDPRSDVFSLGVVLYELLAREHPFRRPTVPATLTAIVRETPPDLSLRQPGIQPGIDRIVRRCLEKRREERYQSAQELAAAVEAVLEGGSSAATLRDVEEKSPYPGLSSFTEEDASRFFGREDEVKTLWRRLHERSLLAVIGPSGAGKTSFVRAGVIPARPDGWAAIVATPGNAPLRSLGQALGPQLAGDPEALRRLAAFEDGDTAFELVSRWRRSHEQALVVVDQFEELFTINPPETQARFAALLGRLAREGDVHVLLSLRDDFLMRCHQYDALGPVFKELTPLGQMMREGLRQALVEPAAKRGYRFEDEALVDEMISAVEGGRGALPLLAFAVARLWERRKPETKLLTREAYQRIGGVAGALAQHAEETMDRIGAAMEPTVRDIFRNLTTAQGTRTVLDREELLTALPDRSAAETVLGKLIDARLVTSWETEATEGQPAHDRVEIVHESLLSAWPRLVRWQTQDADGAQLRDQLRQAAHLWEERERADDLLWTGSSYLDYRVWRGRYPGRLSSLEEDFAASMAALSERKRRRRRIAYAAILAAVALTAAGLGTMWRKSARETLRADAEAARAEAGKLLSLGRLKLADFPNAAIAYAIGSLERSDNDPARRFAVETLWHGPPALFIKDRVRYESDLDWSPDGRWVATNDSHGLALIGRETNERRQLAPAREKILGFTADSQRLVTRAAGGQTLGAAPMAGGRTVVNVWALPEGRLDQTVEFGEGTSWLLGDRLLTFAFDLRAPRGERPALARRLSLDGKIQEVLGRWEPHGLIALAGDPSGTWLFSVQRGRLLQQRLDALSAPGRLLGTHEGGKDVSLMARPWRDRVVTGDAGGTVKIWDVPSARLERTLKSPADARRIALDPRRRFLATAHPYVATRSMFLFDLAAPRTAGPTPLLSESEGVEGMRFSADGTWLASEHGNTAILWNTSGARSAMVGRQEPPNVTLAFTRDGHLLSGSDSGVLRRWPLSPAAGEDVRKLVSAGSGPYAEGGIRLAGVDPGGRFAVAARYVYGEILVVPLDGSRPSVHQLRQRAEGHISFGASSLDPSGRFLAAWAPYVGKPALNAIRILDLTTGEVRTLDAHAKGEDGCQAAQLVGSPTAAGLGVPVWLNDGRLLSDGDAGLRVWDLATGTSRQLRPCTKTSAPWFLLATSDSRTVVRLDTTAGAGSGFGSTVKAFDLSTLATREIPSHGNRVGWFALDARGTTLVTAGMDGVVRVGPLTGEEPHLLYGHTGPVYSVAVSPDGRWIASGGDDGTIRLWPMPDFSKPPLHTLPHDELLAKLKSLTNLRAVRDPASDTGWKIEVGPFPGWHSAPQW